MRRRPRFFSPLYYLAIPFLAAAVGAMFRPGAWYADLQKPPGMPAGMVFAWVWSALYLLMGIAAALVARSHFAYRKAALGVFHLQLLFNLAWSPLFSGLRSPGLGLADLVVLDVAVAITFFMFRQLHRGAAALLLPYLAWVCFATYLNAGIVLLN